MIISTVGVLAGVVLGGLLSARAQSRVWRLGEAERLRHERRRIYAEFLSAARIWRAAIMSPSAVIVEVSTFSRQRHADGGDAAIDVLRLRFEVGLIALSPEMTRLATLVFRAARSLAEARARYAAGAVPDEILDQCRQAEREFAAAARSELGGPPLDR